ncbi:MAG: tripartite tricarboxylate transporter TctB family protein [Burkholderiales bacterium]|nr:tripartite tricarboxylate transporter TctB family protein [Burkholderiales bacterium]
MKLNDGLVGLLLIAFSLVLLVHVSAFPDMPGQNFGPSVLPSLVAVGLILCSLVLIVRALRASPRHPLVEWDAWVTSPRLVFAFLAVIGAVAFYIAFSETLGYLVAAPLSLLVVLRACGVRWIAALALAVLVSLAIHHVFYTLLKVALPWGLLIEYAW